MKLKLKHIVIIQCLLVSLTLYLFGKMFTIALPIWLITIPIWSLFVLYCIYLIGFQLKKRANPTKAVSDDKYEDLVYRNRVLETEVEKLKSSHTEVLKSDKYINFEGLKWMWSDPPEILTQTTYYEIANSTGYNNSRRMETYSSLKDAVANAMEKYNPNNHPKMTEENFEYWNNKTEIITKVTTIKEIMEVVRPEEKI